MAQRPEPPSLDPGASSSGPSDADNRSEELRRRAAAPVFRRIERDLVRVPEAMRPVLRLIRSQLFDPELNVRKMRRVLGLSKNFSSRFKKEMGLGLRRYLEDRRLECASRLLTDTRLDVREIAELAGYGHIRTFKRAFERRMGSRPKEYRRSGGRLGRAVVEGSETSLPEGLRAGGSAEDTEGPPRFVAGVGPVTLGHPCVRCATALAPERRLRVYERTTERVGHRLAESFEPMCDLCALEHATRELLDPLFVQAVGRRGDRREDLDRMIDPEALLAGMRRQLSAEDAEVLIRALVLRYPRSAVVVSDLLRAREAERGRRST